MKIFTAAAVAILLSSGMAFAQDNSGATEGSGNDSNANYLAGPKTNPLYTDDSRKTVRPAAEFKAAWEKMNDTDRADIKKACSANRDVSYNPLCTNAAGM
jgi:hypothetical protein